VYSVAENAATNSTGGLSTLISCDVDGRPTLGAPQLDKNAVSERYETQTRRLLRLGNFLSEVAWGKITAADEGE
jgi:hypothetical protein